MSSDLISKKALLEEIEKYCGNQRYLIPENIWTMIENFPVFCRKTNKNKENLYDLITKRLINKKSELSERQDQFDVGWRNEKKSNCFERNAINDLLIMQQLKSEIAELEHWEMLMRV